MRLWAQFQLHTRLERNENHKTAAELTVFEEGTDILWQLEFGGYLVSKLLNKGGHEFEGCWRFRGRSLSGTPMNSDREEEMAVSDLFQSTRGTEPSRLSFRQVRSLHWGVEA